MSNLLARVKKLEKRFSATDELGDVCMIDELEDGTYRFHNPRTKEWEHINGQEFDDLQRKHKNTRWFIMDVHLNPPAT